MAIDLDAARQAILDGLRLRTRWSVDGQPLQYDFSRAREELGTVAAEVEPRWMRAEWRPLLIFGRREYANGGGATPFLTIHRDEGSIMGFDSEREDDRVFLINSSLPQFIATFRYLDSFLGRDQSVPGDAQDVVRRIDEAAYPASEWRLLLEHLRPIGT